MNNLRLSIDKIFRGALKSFSRFPAAIISAIVISIAAIVRIRMDSEMQKTYNLLFDSIQISFLLGAVFSMAAVVFEEIRSDKKRESFLLANVSGILVAVVSFLLLYFFGGLVGEDKIIYLPNISVARVSAASFISAVAFVYIISKAKSIDSFSDSFFITHRAFIISAIYGLIIMAGVSGVIGAFETLVYKDMDSRVYQYLGVAVGFLTYTIFLGYFPSFRHSENEDEIERIEEQPRFIFVLFEYILIPILMALTVVLLIWSVRVVLKGVDVSFNQLSGIASSYVIIGIWLHIMVAKHKTKLSEFYKRVYPFAGILILIFEAWALFVQLNKFGLKTSEYSFLMIWIFAVISVLLLIFLKDRAYRKIAITAIVISIIWVLPIIGYQDMTFNSQVNRLEEILKDQEILVNDKIKASNKEIEYNKRSQITDAVDFISYSEKQNTPNWFKKEFNDEGIFKDAFGFEKTYMRYPDQSENFETNFSLKEGAIDISDYSLSVNMNLNEGIDENIGTFDMFEGENGIYEIRILNGSKGIPKIIVKHEDKTIIEEDMSKYLEELLIKYPREGNRENERPFEDMNIIVEGKDISVLLVFNNIDVYSDNGKEITGYYVNIQGIYVKFK